MGFSFLHTKEVYYRKVNFDTLKTFLLTTLQEVDDQFLDFSLSYKNCKIQVYMSDCKPRVFFPTWIQSMNLKKCALIAL